MGATRVTDLKGWEKAHQLTLGVYRPSRTLPKEERFGLISQMQRAAVSIPASISEGFIRAGSKDKARFYDIGRASAEELRYYFRLAKDLRTPDEQPVLLNLLDEVCAMLHRLWEVVLAGRSVYFFKTIIRPAAQKSANTAEKKAMIVPKSPPQPLRRIR